MGCNGIILSGGGTISTIEKVIRKRHLIKVLKIKGRKRKDILTYFASYLFNVPVRLVMDRDFLRLKPSDTIDTLIYSFTHEETAAIVTDESGKLLGLITMKDFLRFFTPPKRYTVVGISSLKCSSLSKESTVESIMIKNPITIGVNDSLGQAIRLIVDTGKHHLPVVDKDGKVYGLLEVKDIIRFLRLTW